MTSAVLDSNHEDESHQAKKRSLQDSVRDLNSAVFPSQLGRNLAADVATLRKIVN